MTIIAITTAATINHHHEQAQAHAHEAIDHALEAGKLLLEAKAAIPHGEWVAWVESNIKVTPRQAQRYMGLAQGKPLPVRAIASKTTPVSHLTDQWTPRPAFIPMDGYRYWCESAGNVMDYVIEPSKLSPGYFFISHIYNNADECDFTRRPVRADWVEENLKHFGLKDPAKAHWHVYPHAGVLNAFAAGDFFPTVPTEVQSQSLRASLLGATVDVDASAAECELVSAETGNDCEVL